jgi:phosphopantetheinyl transferase
MKLAVADGSAAPALTARELAQFARLRHPSARAAWLNGRQALKTVLGAFHQDHDTARLVFPHRNFSLSHAGGYAAAMGVDAEAILGVGIDLELRAPHPDSAHRFLTPDEQRWIANLPPPHRADHLRRLWTVKEAALKSYPNNRATTLNQYALHSPQRHDGEITLTSDRAVVIRYFSHRFEHGSLSSAVCRPVTSAQFSEHAHAA